MADLPAVFTQQERHFLQVDVDMGSQIVTKTTD